MSQIVGHLIKKTDGLYGARGSHYDYILAGNGVVIEADGPLLNARAQICEAPVRDLAPMEPRLILYHGRIPAVLLELASNAMLACPEKELYVGIRWDCESKIYRLYLPEQKGGPASVEYQEGDSIILDLHSHGSMPARFSGIDNKDEQGLRLYGVIGRLDKSPEIALRLGVYGYHSPVDLSAVFEGDLSAWQGGKDDDLPPEGD